MPQIAELREINGAVWARVPVMDDSGRVQILTDIEITANDQRMERLLNEIERLRAALEEITRTSRDSEGYCDCKQIAHNVLERP